MRMSHAVRKVSAPLRWVIARAVPNERLIRFANRRFAPRAVNLGGGPAFRALGWHNLDEAGAGGTGFRFTPDCHIPFPAECMHTVYTSHTIEHLDGPTVARLLVESRRILRPEGRLVVKIPDFDRALEAWKDRDPSFFRDEIWNFNAVSPTWRNRGIDDTLSRRASMVFCGFWNREYGDHFSGQVNFGSGAYHGPAIVAEDELQELIRDRTPSQISAYLKEAVLRSEATFKFNHQNAWSRGELADVIERSGFEVVTFDKAVVASCCADIPDIRAMYEQSTYAVAVVKR